MIDDRTAKIRRDLEEFIAVSIVNVHHADEATVRPVSKETLNNYRTIVEESKHILR